MSCSNCSRGTADPCCRMIPSVKRETQRLRAHLLERRERWGACRRHVVARRAVLFVDGFAWLIGALAA